VNLIGRKKWAIRALRSTLKEGSHEKENSSHEVSRRRSNFLCIHGRMFRKNIIWILVRKLRDSDRLKTLGLILLPPCLIFGLYMLFANLLGIPNEILRALAIWLLLFSLFCSGGLVAFYYEIKEKRRFKK